MPVVTLESRKELRQRLLALIDSTETDAGLRSQGEAANEVAHLHLQHGMWEAARHLRANGLPASVTLNEDLPATDTDPLNWPPKVAPLIVAEAAVLMLAEASVMLDADGRQRVRDNLFEWRERAAAIAPTLT